VQIAEKHYLGLVRGIPREARTLEAAMQVEDLVAKVTARVTRPGSSRLSSEVDRRERVRILEGT
jgi:hypothetical protein